MLKHSKKTITLTSYSNKCWAGSILQSTLFVRIHHKNPFRCPPLQLHRAFDSSSLL